MPDAKSGRSLAAFGPVALAVASALIGLAVGVFLLNPGESGAPAGPSQSGRSQGPAYAMRGPPPVTLDRVEIQPLNQTLTAIGTGRALKSLTLTSDVAGIIREIRVDSGQRVAAGAPLVILDRREQEIAVARARADFGIAQTNAARFEELVADEAASALEYEAAQNELSAATAQLRQAEFELSQRTIRAPFDGVVGLVQLDIGDYLTVGGPVASIDDISSLLVDFVVPEGAASTIRPGLAVRTSSRAGSGAPVEGRIRAVDSRINAASRTRRIEAIVPNEDGALIPGSTFSISLDIPGRQAAAVPGLAIQWDRSGSYVWRIDANGAAERISVVILERKAHEVLVEARLNERDLVVTDGADNIRPGMVLVQQDDEDSPTAF